MIDDCSEVVGALGTLATRIRLGANPTTPSATLTQLALDPAIAVRAAVAINSAASPAIDRQLVTDADERVRTLLARKVLGALPGITGAAPERMNQETIGLMFTLVQDEALRIRAVMAEMLAERPGVPRDLVLLLAQDSAEPVSDPVLQLSPQLSTGDLLGLLQNLPHPGARRSIAGRNHLPAEAAEMIAASTDTAAIQAMLANPSASIRESTLDSLITRARDQPEWHEPLARRPSLPPRAARALSEVIAGQWLHILSERTDLPAGLQSDIRQRLWARLSSEHHLDSTTGDEALMQATLRLAANGHLNESVLLDAIHAGDVRRSSALLAVAAGVSLDAVDRAAAMRSAKALVSLVWKAGYSMPSAIAVQTLLGRIGPTELLARTETDFPLGVEEMSWQLHLLTRTRR